MRTCVTCGTKLYRDTVGDLCGVHYREQRANKPLPADLAEHLHEPIADLCVRYGVGRTKLRAWIAESGLERQNRKHRPPERKIPAGFSDNMNMTERQLGVMYKADTKTVRRWRKSLGFTPPPRIKREGTRKTPIKRGITEFMGCPRSTILAEQPIRDDSVAGRAARHLQKYGPCYKEGDHWRRGSSLLTGAEVITRAVSKGFEI